MAAQRRLQPAVLNSAQPGRTHDKLAAHPPSAPAPCGLSTPRCLSGRRDGGQPSRWPPRDAFSRLCCIQHHRAGYAQPRPSSLRAGAVRRCGRCLGGRRNGARQHRRAQPRPSSPPRWHRAPLWARSAPRCLSGRRMVASWRVGRRCTASTGRAEFSTTWQDARWTRRAHPPSALVPCAVVDTIAQTPALLERAAGHGSTAATRSGRPSSLRAGAVRRCTVLLERAAGSRHSTHTLSPARCERPL